MASAEGEAARKLNTFCPISVGESGTEMNKVYTAQEYDVSGDPGEIIRFSLGSFHFIPF